jgi:uncharacterized ferritin-like protein (DUF455 family)
VNSDSRPALDPALFADGPARDGRFTVAARWVECANFPDGHPLRPIEFFHRQMNEEVDSLECSAANLRDFPEAAWDLRMSLARQCADEARHAAMFRRMFERRGGQVGQYPVLNFQYRIITHINSLVGRLAIQNRSFEAGGLDAIAYGIEQARQDGDAELVELFEAQRSDEISHVRFANEWINAATRQNPRSVLEIGIALAGASKAFHHVMGAEGTEGVNYPADGAARREAGFTDTEVGLAVQLQGQPASASPPESTRRR